MKYKDIPSDKRVHFWAGFIITIFFGLVLASDGTEFNHVMRGVTVGFLIGAGAGLIKDLVFDLLLKKGNFELLDIISTVIGSAVAGFLISLLNLLP
jgi:hypothetical protein